MTTTTTPKTTTQTRSGEGNTSIEVAERVDTPSGTQRRVMDFYASSVEDSGEIYLTIRQSIFTAFESDETTAFSNHMFTHFFTREEAEALAGALIAELDRK